MTNKEIRDKIIEYVETMINYINTKGTLYSSVVLSSFEQKIRELLYEEGDYTTLNGRIEQLETRINRIEKNNLGEITQDKYLYVCPICKKPYPNKEQAFCKHCGCPLYKYGREIEHGDLEYNQIIAERNQIKKIKNGLNPG